MDLRTQTSLLAAVLCVALAGVVALRPRKRRVHWLFTLFALTVGAWYATTVAARFTGGGFAERLNLVAAVALPLSAVQFFRAFLNSDPSRSGQLNGAAIVLALVTAALLFTPLHGTLFLGTWIFSYVFVLLASALVIVYRAGRRARSRFERARLTYLAVVGTLAAVFTLAEYLPYVGLDLPPVGSVLIVVFLYVLAQSILRHRLLDLYELAGRLGVLTVLSFSLAGILWVLVALDPGHFFLHSVAAALVLLLMTDPVRTWVERQISLFFFRERHDFETMMLDLRRHLANVLTIEDLVRSIVTAFEASRRLTNGSVYFLDEDRLGYELSAHVGLEPVRRLETAPSRPFLERLRRDEIVVLEEVEREIEESRELGDTAEAERLGEIIITLDTAQASVAVALTGEEETYGILCLRDDRLRDAYSPEELELLKGLAAQASITVENSRLYQRMKERDRLAALGEMSAGLAHEIRNPLGAIKASAQYLADPEGDPVGQEFLDIIVDEVDRLNRVVSSFLDYARPAPGEATAIDVNATLRRTMQMLGTELEGISVVEQLDTALPLARIDPERLRQVLINLVKNAGQAMDSSGTITLRTRARRGGKWVELHITDTGPGVPQRVLDNLFVPFVTTKERGTGLGLAISARIISAAGGRIDVRSTEGVGSTFVIILPADDPSERKSLPPPSPPGTDAPTSTETATEDLSSSDGGEFEEPRAAS